MRAVNNSIRYQTTYFDFPLKPYNLPLHKDSGPCQQNTCNPDANKKRQSPNNTLPPPLQQVRKHISSRKPQRPPPPTSPNCNKKDALQQKTNSTRAATHLTSGGTRKLNSHKKIDSREQLTRVPQTKQGAQSPVGVPWHAAAMESNNKVALKLLCCSFSTAPACSVFSSPPHHPLWQALPL